MAEVKDPVCGETFEEETALEMGASSVSHEGKQYWFCCPACEREFLGEPGRFTS